MHAHSHIPSPHRRKRTRSISSRTRARSRLSCSSRCRSWCCVCGPRLAAECARARWSLECVVEAVGGARVGEAVGAGDFHGLMASHSSIITHPAFAEQRRSREGGAGKVGSWRGPVAMLKAVGTPVGTVGTAVGTSAICVVTVGTAWRDFLRDLAQCGPYGPYNKNKWRTRPGNSTAP